MNGPCEWCGDAKATHKSNHAGVLCDDMSPCMRRVVEQEQVEAWYAAEVERMRERAPA